MTIGTNTAGTCYAHRHQRLRDELLAARAEVRRGDGDLREVERLTQALEQLQADARQNGVRL